MYKSLPFCLLTFSNAGFFPTERVSSSWLFLVDYPGCDTESTGTRCETGILSKGGMHDVACIIVCNKKSISTEP
ncbi:hypothetical protein J1614_002473 [Plenodomus biglobosus]|nr:hypothetical protein J1614_002473 [Plenodomus biglobosus]